MATIVEKQSIKQTFPNKAHPWGMDIRTQKPKRGSSLNPTTHWLYMADSCLYTNAGGTA